MDFKKSLIRMWARYFLLLLFSLMPVQLLMAQPYVVLKKLAGHSSVQNIRFSPDGKTLASCGNDGKVIVWDVYKGSIKKMLLGHKGQVSEVSFSKDGSLLASAGQDGTVRVWNVSDFSQKGVYYTGNKGMELYTVSFVCFSNDKSHLYFGGNKGGVYKVKLGPSDTEDHHKPHSFYPNVGYITGGSIAPDGKSLLISAENGVIAIDGEKGNFLKKYAYTSSTNDVITGPGEQEISAWGNDGVVVTWNYQSGEITKTLKVGEFGEYSAASFDYTHKMIVAGTLPGGLAKVYSSSNNKHITDLAGHGDIVRMARFSPRENVIATASYDGLVRIWVEPSVKDSIEGVITKVDTLTEVENPVIVQEKTELTEEKLKVNEKILLKNIQFEQSKYNLLDSSFPEIDTLIGYMKKYPKMVIRLEGHTDNVGVPYKNQVLSEKRVHVVKNYMVEKGIDPHRIHLHAYGGHRPIADNSKEETRKLNRRVEVLILEM